MSRTASVLLGALLGFALFARLAAGMCWPLPAEVALLAFTIIGGVLFTNFTFRLLRPMMREASRRVRPAWLLGSLLAAVFLSLVIPIPDAPPVWGLPDTLEIEALGQKDPASQGYEVWVLGIFRPDGSNIPVKQLQMDPGWEIRDGIPVWYASRPGRIRWRGWLYGGAQVRMVSHGWSGILRVRWQGATTTLDLYGSGPDNGVVRLAASLPKAPEIAEVILVRAGETLAIGLLLWLIGASLVRYPLVADDAGRPRRCRWLFYAWPQFLSWCFFLLAFWPALLSPDSVEQWSQLRSMRLTDAHPAFHTLCCWLVTRPWPTPSAIVLTQIIAMSIFTGWLLARLREWGAPLWLIWATIGALVFSPAVGTLVVSMWKDIPFALAILGLTLIVLEMAVSRGAWLARRGRWFLLGVVAALVILFRHNGLPVAYGTLLLLFVAFWRQWPRLILAGVTTFGLAYAAQGPLYRCLDVKRTTLDSFWPALVAHHLAGHIWAGTSLQPDEQALMNELHPGPWPCDPYYVDTIYRPDQLNFDVLRARKDELLRLAIKLAWRRPGTAMHSVLNRGAAAWRITQPPASSYYCTPLDSRYDPRVIVWGPAEGINMTPPAPKLRHEMTRMVESTQRQAGWVIWRSPVYLYLLIAGAMIAAVRTRDWRYLLVSAPPLINEFFLLLLAPGQDYRYHLGAQWAGLLLGPFLLLVASRKPVDAPETASYNPPLSTFNR